MFAALPPAPPPAMVSVVSATTGVSAGTTGLPADASAAHTQEHVVAPGETLGHIALRYGVSERALVWANDLGSGDRLGTGQVLHIPTATAVPGTGAPLPGAVSADPLDVPQERVRDAVITAADRFGVDRNLALAVAWNESRWQQHQVSHKGAVGAMQCLPVSGRWMSARAGHTLNLENVDDNATCGVLLLRTLQEGGNDENTVLAAYNQGLTSVRTNGVYAQTWQYVQSVQWLRDQLAWSPPASPPAQG